MGDSPLHLAAAHNHLEVLALLLQAKADCRLQNKDRQTAEQLGCAAVASLLSVSKYGNQRATSYPAAEYEDESD